MDDWLTIILLTSLAGAAMPLGAAVACVERVRPQWIKQEFRHGVIAFGGGALLSAVALVLVPEGAAKLPTLLVAVCFGTGGVTCMALDVLLDSIKSPSGQLVAMLSDFIPEAIALGATVAAGGDSALLLAGLMALQNLPEGFNSCRELTSATKISSANVVIAFTLLALFGPIAGLAGLWWLSGYPGVVAGTMLFAAGGILYIVFQDIAPQVRLQNRWLPPLGAVAGFLLGIVGQMMVSQ